MENDAVEGVVKSPKLGCRSNLSRRLEERSSGWTVLVKIDTEGTQRGHKKCDGDWSSARIDVPARLWHEHTDCLMQRLWSRISQTIGSFKTIANPHRLNEKDLYAAVQATTS